MKQAKVSIMITRIINLDPKIYDHIPNVTDEQMLEDELRYATDLPHEWMDSDNVQWETKAEMIEGEEQK